MEKISAKKLASVVLSAASTIRKLAAERDSWRKVAEERMTHDEAVKVAAAMEERGLVGSISRDELISSLEKAASEGRLDVIKEAVELVGPNMDEKIASMRELNGGSRYTHSRSAFESFILSGD